MPPLSALRSVSTFLAPLAGGLAFASAAAMAQPTAAPASAELFAPHAASYSLRLHSVRSGSGIADVRGDMRFSWGDACDGWTVEQRYEMDLYYAEGAELTLESAYATWEAKDGREFSFTLESGAGGFVDKDIRGHARLAAADPGSETGGIAQLRRPEPLEITLPPGTVFPTWHTLVLLDMARDGANFYAATLFDGTDIDAPMNEVTAIIGRVAPAPDEAAFALLDRPGWPVRMAFFTPGEHGSEPDYEIALTLLDNGVVSRMDIDYGDFVVRATLSDLVELPRSGC